MKFTALRAIIVAACVTFSMAKDADVKIRDDLLDLIGNSTCEGQNNCWRNWIKCAGKVAACAAECMNNTTSQSCISCLAPLYNECKDCFSEIEVSKKNTETGCSAWDWLKCAGDVARCAAQCAKGITSQACISCLGSAYEECKKCFNFTEAIQKQVAVRIKVHAVQSCSAMQWLKCAGVVAKCAAECIQGVMSQTCISCLGDSYNECKGCFSVIKEFQQHENQETRVSSISAKVQGCDGWQMFECAGILVECGAVCAPGEIDAPACIKCMGNFYDTCKDCFSTLAAIEKQAAITNNAQSKHVEAKKESGCDTQLMLKGCTVWDWLKCAATVARCAAQCAEHINATACISCMGSSYDQCKGCFSLIEQVQGQDGACDFGRSKGSSYILKGCGAWTWLKCAAVVAACAAVCVASEIDLPACIACMGGLYNTCKDCFSYVDIEGRLKLDVIV